MGDVGVGEGRAEAGRRVDMRSERMSDASSKSYMASMSLAKPGRLER
jgi:hypothetical protein